MIGNDIIDLKEVSESSRTRRQRFLNKVFTIDEQAFLLTQNDINGSIWLLWSMKESAWKAHYRNSSIRLFSPKLMQCKAQYCSIEGDFVSGIVSVEKKQYQTFSLWKNDLIHTTANSTAVPIEHDFFRMAAVSSKGQSAQVRNKVCQTISSHLGYSLNAISIGYSNHGVPQVIVNGVNSNIKLSISHHGRFGAYAICYEPYKND